MAICMMMALSIANFAGSTIVLLVDAPEGQVCHCLMRSFGKEYGGGGYIKRGPLPGNIKMIVCSSYPDKTMCDLFAPAEEVTVTTDWDKTLSLLEAEHPGSCLLYTSDAADDLLCVDLGGRRIIKKKKNNKDQKQKE